jgi:RNA polymerase sigma-70 factor (ECF subfamily)
MLMLPTAPDDALASLTPRLAAGDSAAMAEVFERLHDPLVRYAAGLLRDDAAARDVVQDAFVRLWGYRDELDPAQSVRPFLFRTVRNLVLNQVRDARRRAELLAEHDAPLAWRDPGPEAIASANDLQATLQALIDALPPRQREALVLSRFDGLSHAEVAEVMGCSARTVNNHLVRALETLRSRLTAGGLDVEAA